MNRMQTMIIVAGLLHFCILSASALVPIVLDWKRELAPLHPFVRQLMWVYGAFVVMTIIAFGVICLFRSADLAGGSSLARALCAFIAFFWSARLFLQLFVFDIRPFIKNRWLLLGDHGLTVVFAYFTVTFWLAAAAPTFVG